MANNLIFDNGLIKQAEVEYGKLSINPKLLMMIEGIAQVYSQYLNLSVRALKGFIWRVTREYQVKNQIVMDEQVFNLSKDKQIKIAEEMGKILEDTLKKTLVNQDQIPLLKEALKKALEFHKEQISKM